MKGIQILLVYGNWAGSILFGWFHFFWWLAVPPVMWAWYAFGMTALVKKHQLSLGITHGTHSRKMFMPNIWLTLRNTAINCVIFAFAAGVSALTK